MSVTCVTESVIWACAKWRRVILTLWRNSLMPKGLNLMKYAFLLSIIELLWYFISVCTSPCFVHKAKVLLMILFRLQDVLASSEILWKKLWGVLADQRCLSLDSHQMITTLMEQRHPVMKMVNAKFLSDLYNSNNSTLYSVNSWTSQKVRKKFSFRWWCCWNCIQLHDAKQFWHGHLRWSPR